MQKYDLFLILSHNLSETEAPAKVQKIKDTLVSLGGEEISANEVGRQKLAYQVKGERAGYFVNVFFSLDQDKIAGLRNTLNLDNEVARFMLALKKDIPVPAETAAITSVFEKVARQEKPFEVRNSDKAERASEIVFEEESVEDKKVEKVEKTAKTEKKEINLEDINKKIDEILQQDNFVV